MTIKALNRKNKKGSPPEMEEGETTKEIQKPNRVSTKGEPPVLELTPVVNLNKPSSNELVQLPLAIDAERKKEIKTIGVEINRSMVSMLMEGWELFKEKYNIK